MALPALKIYTLHPNVKIPKFGTEQAACFDMTYQPWGKDYVNGFNNLNKAIQRPIPIDGRIYIVPGDRLLLPTGMIFDIPKGYSLRVHPRSGMSVKRGLILANCEGIIDSDYFHETFITVYNISNLSQDIELDTALAQAELVKSEKYTIEQTEEQPTQKTNRVGGFGSTDEKKI